MGVSESEGERLHAVVVPDMEEFRRRGRLRFRRLSSSTLESLSKQLPSYYRILSFSIRHEPLPENRYPQAPAFRDSAAGDGPEDSSVRTGSRGGASSIQGRCGRRCGTACPAGKAGYGAARHFNEPGTGSGLRLAGSRGTSGSCRSSARSRIDEEKAARIYTLGELIDELKAASPESGRGRNWKEILNVPPDNALHQA